MKIAVIVVALVELLCSVFLSLGCTTATQPTLAPVGYFYMTYPPAGTPDSSHVQLTRVIWGPYMVRFLGTTTPDDQVHLQAVLYRNEGVVGWWPEHQNVLIHGGTWEIAVNANDYQVPGEIPQPGAGYSLEVIDLGYGTPLVRFDLPFPGPGGENVRADNATKAALDGTSWVLSSIDGHRPLLFTRVTLDFNEGAASGSGGCNTYGAEYETMSPDMIVFSGPVSTLLSCGSRAIANQESVYLNSLRNAAAYRILGNQLELYDVVTNRRSLVFTRLKTSKTWDSNRPYIGTSSNLFLQEKPFLASHREPPIPTPSTRWLCS